MESEVYKDDLDNWRKGIKTGIAMSEKVVDYMDLVSRFDADERTSRGEQVVLPEPAGEQVVDYQAVSKLWKEEKMRLVNEKVD